MKRALQNCVAQLVPVYREMNHYKRVIPKNRDRLSNTFKINNYNEMKKIFFLLAVMLIEFSAFAQNTSLLLDNYIDVKNALVSSNGVAASESINILYNTVKEEETFPQKAELLKASEKLYKAGNNIDKQRAALNYVSNVMWELVKGSEKVDETIYYQYCPMKKAHWLSLEKEIKNPYYGSSMLTCGEVVETKE